MHISKIYYSYTSLTNYSPNGFSAMDKTLLMGNNLNELENDKEGRVYNQTQNLKPWSNIIIVMCVYQYLDYR